MSFFNHLNNANLILAIQSSGVSRGRNSFYKDKFGEPLARWLYRRQKLALSEVIGLPLSKRSGERNLIEHRTDGTDAFEILYIGAEKFTFHDTFSLSMSGVL